ncbi:MAG: hypothetical protein IKD21_00495 [Clostridia bacterium]|nr:hypothetical protein [Clostridia bacterium]
MYSDKTVSDSGVLKNVFLGFGKAMLVALGFTLIVFFCGGTAPYLHRLI